MAKRRTQQDVLDLIRVYFNDEYELLSTFTKTNDPITLKHKVCGNVWSPLANNFFQGKTKCPQCSGKKHLTNEVFQAMLDDKTDNQFELVGDFNGHSSKKKTKLRHKECGYEFEVTGGHFNWAKPIGCRYCSNKLIHTTERVNELIVEKLNGDYTLLAESYNNTTPIQVKHDSCGHIYDTTSNNLINNGDICPKCFKRDGRQSLGEKRIEVFLTENNIKFDDEFPFDDCVHINKLRFDFVVFDSNDDISFLVEFDGKQHFEPVEYFGGEDGFKLTQKRDGIKNMYCIDNGLKLIRIPYWDENKIEDILSGYLKEFNLMEVA